MVHKDKSKSKVFKVTLFNVYKPLLRPIQKILVCKCIFTSSLADPKKSERSKSLQEILRDVKVLGNSFKLVSFFSEIVASSMIFGTF